MPVLPKSFLALATHDTPLICQNSENKAFCCCFRMLKQHQAKCQSYLAVSIYKIAKISEMKIQGNFFHFFQKTSFFEFKVRSFTFNIYFDKSSTIPYSTVLIISDKMGPQTVWIKHSTKILSSYRFVGMFMGRGGGVVSKVNFRQIQNWS